MKHEVAVDLLKVAAQLVETTVANKNCIFGKDDKALSTDIEKLFARSVAAVKKEFDALANS